MTTDSAQPVAPDAAPAWVQRAERWVRFDSGVRQAAIVLAVAVLTFTFVHPPPGTLTTAATYALIGLNLAFAATRLLPDRTRERVPAIPFYVVGAVLAGALLALDRTNITSLFGYFLAGNAGFRLQAQRAFTISTLVGALGAAGVLVGNAVGWTDVPWYLGAFTGVSVFFGVANRSRAQAEAAMRAAAESRVVAAEADSRAHSMAERARIARDVHDVLAHSLASINLQLEVVDALLENGDTEQARAAAGRAQHQVREGLAEVSRTVHNLREDALPLVDTLRSLVGSGAPAGTTFEVVGERRDVPTPISTALARVAQESLTNSRKHAPAAPVGVRVTFAAGTIALDVVNGPGTARAALADTGSGMGLVGMRERVEIVGGHVRTGPVVDGEHAGGWLVHAEIPA